MVDIVQVLPWILTALLAIIGIVFAPDLAKYKNIAFKKADQLKKTLKLVTDLIVICENALKDNKISEDEMKAVIGKVKEIGNAIKVIGE